MIKRTILLVYLTWALALSTAGAQAGQGCSSCTIIEHALRDAQSLKAGMVRKDLESHNFTMAGGMVLRDHTSYVYKGCDYIKIEVDFNPDPAVDKSFSDKDVITGISRLTLEFPAKD